MRKLKSTSSDETYVIQLARADVLSALPSIEIKAGQLFAEAGLPDIADSEPADVEYFESFARAGAVHVALDAMGAPVGFSLTGLLDGAVHLYELSVDPAHGRRGLGRRLVEAGCTYGKSHGCKAMTLSTFRDLAWNGPFYSSIGFRELSRAEWTPGHYTLHEREKDIGLPVERRCFMRREFQDT